MTIEWSNDMRRIIGWMKETGSSWMPVDKLPDLNIQSDVAKGQLVIKSYYGKEYVTFPYYRDTEQKVVNFIQPRINTKVEIDKDKIMSLIREYEAEQTELIGKEFKFSDEQEDAILNMLSTRFAITTGGPGTGKTSIIQCLIKIIKVLAGKYRPVIALTAPTGKAAKRMEEATGLPATTLQMFTGGVAGSRIKIKGPDYLLIDEFSMADEETLHNLVDSILPSTIVYLFGDSNQLPSVGIGSVLKDLMNCSGMPVVQLVKTFRQDNSSTLFRNIKIVENGGYIPLEEGSDFKCIRNEENILEVSVKEYLDNVERFGRENTVILTAYRKEGKVCAEKLNTKIQSILNPPTNGNAFLSTKVERDPGRWIPIVYRVGDPVIQLKNNQKVANGEVGTISAVKDGIVYVKYPTGTITYKGKQLSELDLAYALSVHKSQGSQYACVVFPVLSSNKNLSRNLVYTAISRAKKHCVVIGKDETIAKACKTQSDWERTTFLREEYEIQSKALEIRSQIIICHGN